MNLLEGADEAVPPVEPAMTSIRVHRLNGEVLEVSLTNAEANKLEFNRDLKRCLANRDRGEKRLNLAIGWIRLIQMDTGLAIADEDRITWEWLEQGSLQYVVADVMSFAWEELPPSDDLLFFYADLHQLLDSKQLIAFAYQIWSQRGQAFFEHVLVAWKSALLGLPREEVNAIEDRPEKMLPRRCLDLLEGLVDVADDFLRQNNPHHFQLCRARGGHGGHGFFCHGSPSDAVVDSLHWTFASGIIEFVKQKLDVETVELAFECQSFQCWEDTSRDKRLKGQLWKLVQGDPELYFQGRHLCQRSKDLRFGLGAEVMMALIQKNLPRWCWAGYWGDCNETLLQRVMVQSSFPPIGMPSDWNPQDAPKAELCAFLAERLSLEKLCHQAQDGTSALARVEQICEGGGWRWRQWWWPWPHVYDVIKEQMELRVKEFPGNLLQLVELARCVRTGLGCSYGFAFVKRATSSTSGGVDSLDSLPAFGEQMWHRAAAIREEWLRMGWTFAEDTVDGQISQVLNWHVDAVGRGIQHLG